MRLRPGALVGRLAGAMDFSTLLRELMRERDMTGRGLARRVPCDPALVSRLASGKQRASPRIAGRLDEVLDAGGTLKAAAGRPVMARLVPAWWMPDDVGEDDVNRRDMLAAMIAGPLALQMHLEELRRQLDGISTVPASEHDADEWAQVAAGYARQVSTMPAVAYLPHLLADAGEITGRVNAASGTVRLSLARSAAQIAALTAIAMSMLGDQRTAARWWRTSARVAAESGDRDLAALIAGRQAVLALYGPGGNADALTRSDLALAAAGGRAVAGAASAHAARAQAYCRMGRHQDALASLDDLRRIWDRLPSEDVAAADSEWGQPERRVRHTESWVLTLAGATRAAFAAQDAALALYPVRGRGRTQVEMHRAETLIRSGDIDGGARHCTQVLASLAPAWRGDTLITSSARAALSAVPAAMGQRQPVREAREMLALPAGRS
jgi:hypothetical protein